MLNAIFYVYIYFRRDGSPCYVGRGRGRRWLTHFTRSSNRKLAEIIATAGGELPVIKIRENLTAHQAREIEEVLIAAIGREVDGGPLVNLSIGGDGGRGRIMSDEERERRRQILSSPEVRAKLSASHIGKPSSKKGKKMAPEFGAKMSLRLTGKRQSQITIDRRRIGQIEYWSKQENRDRQSQIQIDRYSDPRQRRLTGLSIKLGIWRNRALENANGR